jgi:hypothetical protein
MEKREGNIAVALHYSCSAQSKVVAMPGVRAVRVDTSPTYP